MYNEFLIKHIVKKIFINVPLDFNLISVPHRHLPHLNHPKNGKTVLEKSIEIRIEVAFIYFLVWEKYLNG